MGAFGKFLLTGAAVLVPALAAPAAAQDCDRACLIALADRYAGALAANSPDSVRWAPDAVVMENLEQIQPGEGGFNSITRGPKDFAVHVPDPVSQQVGLLAMMREGSDHVLVGIRLKLAGGAIAEAEHLIARNLTDAQLENLKRPRVPLLLPVPQPYRDSRERLIWIGQSYYDALDMNNSTMSPMADDCVRHENGYQTARNSFTRPGTVFTDSEFAYLGGLGCAAQIDTNMWEYIDTIENRRVEIADVETGLVWGMSHFHHLMDKDETRLVGVPWFDSRDMSRFNPFDMPAIHIYKVWGGHIHEIEALGIVMPYQSPHSFAE